LGVLGFYQGAYDEADRLLGEGLEISRGLGNAWAIAYSLDFLSTSAYARGAYAEAENLLQEGLVLSQQVGDRFTTAYALNGLGLVKQSLEQHAEARQLLEDSISIWREIGDLASMAQSLNNLGNAFLETNEPDEAQKCFIEALSVGKNAGLIPVMLDALLGNATLRASEGLHKSAFRTLAYIKAHPASTQATKSRAEKLYTEFGSKLSAWESETLSSPFHEEILDQLVQDVLRR
jgi:tetratricopeptide (TPR) repeat protein